MAVTFNPSLLTDIDRMRDILGDTNIDSPYAEDETYEARLILASGSWKLAAASMARSFAARAINNVTSFTATGDMSVSWTDRASAWLNLARALEEDAARDASMDSNDNVIWSVGTTRRDRPIRGEYSKSLKER